MEVGLKSGDILTYDHVAGREDVGRRDRVRCEDVARDVNGRSGVRKGQGVCEDVGRRDRVRCEDVARDVNGRSGVREGNGVCEDVGRRDRIRCVDVSRDVERGLTDCSIYCQ